VPKEQEIAAKVAADNPLFDLVVEAYHVFDYPKPTSTEVCVRCCMEPEIEDDFFNPPIRELPLRYVQDWFEAACDPSGIAKETWAYFLPRILEILAAGEDPAPVGIQVSLSRYETGNRANWSNKEWDVLHCFQREFLRLKVAAGSDTLDDVLCMFRLAGWPLTDLLNQVASMPTPLLAERLWSDWCAGCVPGREDVRITSFWESPDNSNVFEFYTSVAMRERFTSLALSDGADRELAERAFAVAAIIESHASS
jgi:hypothetical protein